MTGVWRLLGAGAALLLLAYFIRFAARAFDPHVLQWMLHPEVLVALMLATLLYAAIIPLSALAWARLLQHQGEHWRAAPLARIMGLTQLAKYIPGNVAQFAGRAAMAMRAGMGSRACAITVIQESLLAIAASLLIGLAALSQSASAFQHLPTSARLPLALLTAALALVVVTFGSIKLAAEPLLSHRRWWMRMLGHAGGLPGAATVLPVLAVYSLNYLMIGAGLSLVARAAEMPVAIDFSTLTAAFALSWALGFLTPGSPAGIGVREGTMVLLMTGAAPDEVLLVIVMLARAVTVAGDGVCFLVASLSARGAPPVTDRKA